MISRLYNYSVYKHTSPSGKVYIGITKNNPNIRWSNGHGYSRNKKFLNAILKYGWVNIKHEIILDKITKEHAIYTEKYLIRWYKIHQMSYNITDGGEGTKGIKKEDRYFYGKHLSESHRNKISTSKKGIATKVCPVLQFNLNGEFIAEYSSISIAAKLTNSDGSRISACCYGKRNKTNNYKWKFKYEDKNYKYSE